MRNPSILTQSVSRARYFCAIDVRIVAVAWDTGHVTVAK